MPVSRKRSWPRSALESAQPVLAIILGIDPGSRITGYGIVRVDRHHLTHLEDGCVRLGEADLASRLVILYDALSELVEHHRPVAVAVEQVFMNRNADSALKLGHARGVALLAAARAGVAVSEYAATLVKQTVVGRGHADKTQVQHMVRALLRLERTPATDAADALAVAICHAHHSAGIARLALAGGR